MRRADRLFQIIQILRRRNGLITGRELAEELEVSLRTVYRDVSDLIGSGVPIEGEPGVGYLLRGGFDLPPLMFTAAEIDSVVLGARIVESWGDPELGKAARDVLAKVETMVPSKLKHFVTSQTFTAPPSRWQAAVQVSLADLRHAIHDKRKLRLDYADEKGNVTERVVWPLTLSFYGPVWVVASWCELRSDFRAFRADRMREAGVLDERFPDMPGRRLSDYLEREKCQKDQTFSRPAAD